MPEFNPSLYSRPGLQIEEIEEIRESFLAFDPDENDRVSIETLVASIKALGFDRKSPQIFKVIKEIKGD